MGKYDSALMNLWQCTQESCLNKHDFCYVEGSDHYVIDKLRSETWARQIEAGQATIENPPITIYRFLKSAGPVDKQFKQPLQHQKTVEQKEEKKDFGARLSKIMDMQGHMMEMNMSQAMMDTVQRMNQQHAAPQSLQQPYQPPPPPSLPPFSPFPPFPPISLSPTEPSNPPPHTSIMPNPPDRPSSPITISDDEDDAIDAFFT
jgi:hypothetical protein